MPNIHIHNLQRTLRQLRHRYGTLNNIVVAAAFLIAGSWAVSSVGVMEKNYRLQQDLDVDRQRLELVKLQVENLKFRERYYQTDEFKELSLRQHMGVGFPGEKALILPPNSEAATTYGQVAQARKLEAEPKKSNFDQWMEFFGHKSDR